MFEKNVANIVIREKENGNVEISKSVILQPEIKFSGGTIKWLPDNYKSKK